jgi:glycosyltransferase involved in cell wall biosynthesis
MPDVSMIVPTHNRAAMLRQHLRALAVQTYPRQATERIVVCDGCVDDSAGVAREAGADRGLLIPRWGAVGAAIANATIQGTRALAILIALWRRPHHWGVRAVREVMAS